MLVIAPILIFLVAAIALAMLAWVRPRFSYQWLLVTGASFLAWAVVWIWRFNLPRSIQLSDWTVGEILKSSPVFTVEGVSWPFSLALVTLILAVFLTDVLRAANIDWRQWVGILLIGSAGLLAVISGNILTTVMTWVLLDGLELAILMQQVEEPEDRRGTIVFFSTNMLGTMLVLLALVIAQTNQVDLTFESITPEIAIYLIVAAGLRLGIIPLQTIFLLDVGHQRSLGTVIKLATPTASLVFLARVGQAGLPLITATWFYLFLALAALYGAIAWVQAANEMDGQRFWIIALSSIALAAAVSGQPAAVIAWSLVLVYSGGLLFLSILRQREILWLSGLGLLGITTFPFTQGAAGAGMYASPMHPMLPLFILSQAVITAGYARHALSLDEGEAYSERWLKLVYPTGLAVLPFSHWLSSTLFSTRASEALNVPIWPGISALLLAVLVWVALRRGLVLNALQYFERIEAIFSLRWFYQSLGGLFRRLGVGARFITNLLEGQGGVLWALLILTLILSLVGQISGGIGG